MAKIRCVMFDYAHVLAPFDTETIYVFLREHRGNCLDPRELFSGASRQILLDYDLGKINDFEYFEKIKQVFQSDMQIYDFFKLLGEVMKLDWKMLKIRNELRRRGIIVVLITNMNPFHAGYIRRNYPEVFNGFDHNFISCKEGVAKPDPEAWIKPLDTFGLKAEECIFIDDTWENIKAADKLGIKTWYYRVRDPNFCLNGKVEVEREKFRHFLAVLDSYGLLYDKNRICT